MPSLFLAWRYLRARPGQSAVMVLGLALALYLPLVTHRLVDEFDRTIGARAASTPLVIGPKELDPVAYVRFASVYRNFREEQDFVQFVDKIDVFKKK